MNKTKLIKLFSILAVVVMVIMFNTNVFAANNTNGFSDLTSTINTSNSNKNNTDTNTNISNTNNNTNTANTNNVNTANNTSKTIYNNTNLPKTGIEDSLPVAMLVVVFGISAIYAYRKVSEYRNI